MLFHRDGTVELGVADDVTSYTTVEDNDDMSVEEEQATAAASDPSPPSADEEKAPVPHRRSKRGLAASKAQLKPEPSKKKKPAPKRKARPPARAAASRPSRRAASTAVQQPSGSRALSFKKKTSFTGKAVYITGWPDKFRNKSIIQDIAKKMGAILAKSGSGQVKILIVLPKAPGKGTRDACTNATERSEDYFIESACKAVTNFPPGSTADEKLDLLIQDVSTQPSSSITGQMVSPRIICVNCRPFKWRTLTY